ncbi:autotransporter outer membrane beta-barrel domain-containing protein [Haemophilus haemolyticus]|uniref:autotransporter outer membrane beta-barrel domain-containing protein n=2 Tax=Haemophilus haemolyticus TaxID=726 RepID=UPI000E57247C|nr:autotransporter outer membrane beta-barrel domain-containing protein [Haemophilus haemolyticus]
MKNRSPLFFLSMVTIGSHVQAFDANTDTVNNWDTVDIHSHGKKVEDTSDKIKYEFNYKDGDIIGTKNWQPHSGGSTINKIIDVRNRTSSTDALKKDITETTIKTPGNLNIIHVDDGTPISWQDGVQVYNSNNKNVERSETILNFDTELNVDITTHRNYSSRYYSIFNVFDVDGQGNSAGDVTKPVSIVNLLKKTTVKTTAQSIPEKTDLSLPERRVNVFLAKSNGGGESHLTFKDDLTMESKSTKDNLQLTGFRLENRDENRFKKVSEKDTIDKENGGSTLTFEGNVGSSMTGNTTTKLWFLSNTQIGGGVKVTSKAGKTFTSEILNTSTDNNAESLNLYSKTTTNGESKLLFNSNMNLITSNKNGSIWGMFLDAEENGKNILEFNGDKNEIKTSNDGTSAWVYGIKTSSTNGENNIKLKNTNITTNSNYVARSIEISDENLGKNNFELENANINTVGNYSYGINIESSNKNNGSGENTINFKGENTFNSTGGKSAWGFRIVKNKVNRGEGTKITSDQDSTLNIVSKGNTVSHGIYLSHEEENNKANTTFNGKVNIDVSTNDQGYGVYHSHKKQNNVTNTVFNNDTVIRINGNGRKMAVYNETPETTPDDSKSIISFNKKLTIDGEPTDPALVSSGKNAEITVAGKDDVNILGNIFTSNKGKVTLNLLNKNSYLVGLAKNNDTGIIDMKLANSSNWLMTDDSKINTLDISSEGTVHFSNTENTATLSVDNLKGNGGIFKMQGNVQAGKTDLLSIKTSSEGNHYIEFKNMADSKSTGTEVLQLVESSGKAKDYKAVFSLLNEDNHVSVLTDDKKPSHPKAVIEKGAYLYTLGRATDSKIVSITDANVNNWYLFPYEDDGKGKLTPGAESSLSFSNTIYQINLLNTETLVQRLGEIHFDKTDLKPHNAWIKHVNGKYTSFANDTIGSFSTHYWGIKAGFDWLSLRNNWVNYNGISIENLNASTYPKRFEGKTKIYGKGIGIYSTWLNKNNDIYVDLVGKMMRYKGKYDIVNYSNENIKSNNASINSYLLSIETGKRSYLLQKKEKAFYIQPEMQLIYQFVDDYTLHSSNGLKSMTKNSNSLIGRIGFRAGLDFYGDSVLSPYIKLMYNKEFLGSVLNDLNTAKIEMNNKDDWFNYGVGISHENKKKGRQIYLDVQRSNKHLIRQDWQVNLGLRYSF